MSTNINQLATTIHSIAKEKGWWEEEERNFGETLALIHQELSEALEEYRKGRGFDEVYFSIGTNGNKKPEGIPVELADAIIRILDFTGKYAIDMDAVIKAKMEYNKTRPYRHGNLRA